MNSSEAVQSWNRSVQAPWDWCSFFTPFAINNFARYVTPRFPSDQNPTNISDVCGADTVVSCENCVSCQCETRGTRHPDLSMHSCDKDVPRTLGICLGHSFWILRGLVAVWLSSLSVSPGVLVIDTAFPVPSTGRPAELLVTSNGS